MKDATGNGETSLWECLHDGSLKAFRHDAMSRIATLTWDVPYLWSFHSLPRQTRFEMSLEGTTEMQVLDYQPWPGATSPLIGVSWKEQEVIRKADAQNAFYTSGDWRRFSDGIATAEYEASNASIAHSVTGDVTLSLDLAGQVTSEYPTVQVNFKRLRIALSTGQELTLEQFLAMGAAYWNDFAERSAASRTTSAT